MGHPPVIGHSFSIVWLDILVILGGKNCPILFKVNFQIVLTLVYNPANFWNHSFIAPSVNDSSEISW